MGLIMMLLLSTLIACQVMDNPGHVFSTVALAEEINKSDAQEGSGGESSAESDTQSKDEKAVDPLFEDPQEEVIQMGVDKPAEETVSIEPPVTDPVTESEAVLDASASPGPNPAASGIAQPSVASWRPATVKDGWRPTLVGTLMDGPTPRAVLAMPSGEEKVVKAGDMLSDDGVVVMTIGDKFIELAVIRSDEGRAQIENLTLSTQF